MQRISGTAISFVFLLSLVPIFSDGQSLNVSLIGKINPDTTDDVHFSGIWGYVSANGNEYALLGGLHGLYVIDVTDSMNLQVVDSVPARDAYWREVKVVDNYAFVTSQVFDDSNAMQIIDLTPLPDSVHLASTFDSTFTSAHTIECNMSEDDHCIYVCGPLPTSGTNGGVHILDVTHPEKPIEISRFSTNWIHDCYVSGNLMYACESTREKVDIVDIHDRTNPVLIGEIEGTGLYTHSCWPTDDGKALMVCAEVDNFPAHVYSVSDLSNISEIASIRCVDNTTLIHNVMIKNKFAYVAENDAGFRVFDFSDPALPVEVGYYQTYLGAPGHSVGCYHVYTFLPSGRLLVSDRESGLFVLRFHPVRAARIYGDVVNKSGQAIYNGYVQIGDDSTATDLTGHFKTGFLPVHSTQYTLHASAPGLLGKDTLIGQLEDGDSVYVHLVLDSIPEEIHSSELQISLKENPVKDEITFQIENGKSSNGNIFLTDAIGRIVSSRDFIVSDENEFITVSASALSSGIYLARISVGEEKLFFKIVLL